MVNNPGLLPLCYLPAKTSQPLLQWWWPRERKLQILFTETLSALWHHSVFIPANPQEKAVTLCFIIVQTVISTIANFQHPSPSASMGTAATDISQLRKSVSALTQVSILYFFISLKTKVSHPPPWVLLGGGSKQYFMVIGHIYTSNWCICQPWCVGWSIKPCQSGVMLVLSLFSFARWTKVKTNWEHMALPFFFFLIRRDHLSLFVIIHAKEKRIDWQHWVDLWSFLIPFSLTD